MNQANFFKPHRDLKHRYEVGRMAMNDTEIRNMLHTSIYTGKIVVLFDHNGIDIMQLLCKELVSRKTPNVEIWQSIGEELNAELSKYVSKEIIDKAIDIYRMYDFSDKVFVISDSDQYGSMFNYLKTGILTKQEMVDALLYKIK